MSVYARLIALLFLMLISAGVAVGEPPPVSPWVRNPKWTHVRLPGAVTLLPIRTVAEDEPWELVVQDVQAYMRTLVFGRPGRVGFYGHGAFVTSAQVQDDLLFVAALGAAAEMDVMVFPHWRFPTRHPLAELPWNMLLAQLKNLQQHPAETAVETMKSTARQFARDNHAATAHAAVRLAEGLSTFHAQHLTPSLAAFSNSALVTVRLGQLLEAGQLGDGTATIAVPEGVRQGIYLNNLVTFGYPLPNGQIAPALQQRVRGTLVNVVPVECWQQWGGNFLLRGGVNLPVSWAPAHADWPRLSPYGPEVRILGALLGGQSEEQSRHALTGFEPRQPRDAPLLRGLWNHVCAHMQRFDPAIAFDQP